MSPTNSPVEQAGNPVDHHGVDEAVTDVERPTPGFKRINVSVSAEMVDAIKNVMERDGVGLTEAVRRLISYGDFLYRKANTPGQELMIREGDTLRGVYLLV